MDTQVFMEVFCKHIDKNFNVDNELVGFIVKELNAMELNINNDQAQHIVNIIEYVSKSTSKNTVVTIANSLLELGILKGE